MYLHGPDASPDRCFGAQGPRVTPSRFRIPNNGEPSMHVPRLMQRGQRSMGMEPIKTHPTWESQRPAAGWAVHLLHASTKSMHPAHFATTARLELGSSKPIQSHDAGSQGFPGNNSSSPMLGSTVRRWTTCFVNHGGQGRDTSSREHSSGVGLTLDGVVERPRQNPLAVGVEVERDDFRRVADEVVQALPRCDIEDPSVQ